MSKSKKCNFAQFLYNDRFTIKNEKRNIKIKHSIIEHAGLANLNELLNINNKMVYNSKDMKENIVSIKYSSLLDNLNYQLSIPPRIPYNLVDKDDYETVELLAFNHWKKTKQNYIFECNLEIWRQFWIVCEKSDTICQIVDARYPDIFYNKDIELYYPQKNHIILYNKADLIDSNSYNSNFYYSAKNNTFNFSLNGTIGFVGYPNVGKSSTINMINKMKKVSVSNTPGKTKHFQTIKGNGFVLYDSPGLIFPKHTKIELILMGVLNIDHTMNLKDYENDIIKFIGEDVISSYYKIQLYQNTNILELVAQKIKCSRVECIKTILKDFILK